MGGSSSSSSERQRILVVGLTDSGKSTVLRSLRLGDVSVSARHGVDLETVQYKNIVLTARRCGPRPSWWRRWEAEAQAVIFVIDSSNVDRLDEARDHLHGIVSRVRAPCLVYANKQDKAGARGPQDLRDHLGLLRLRQRSHVQPCVATNATGLYEGLDWLASVLADDNGADYDDAKETEDETPFDCLVAPLAVVFGPKRGTSVLGTIKVVLTRLSSS